MSHTSERILTNPDDLNLENEDTASRKDCKRKESAKISPEPDTNDV